MLGKVSSGRVSDDDIGLCKGLKRARSPATGMSESLVFQSLRHANGNCSSFQLIPHDTASVLCNHWCLSLATDSTRLPHFARRPDTRANHAQR
jgi:hypothetical protein